MATITITGTNGDDRGANALIGGDLDEILLGLGGSDLLLGKGGNDTLNGGSGNDILTGGLGSDFIDGGADFDDVMEITSGTVTLTSNTLINTDRQGNKTTDTLLNVERVNITADSAVTQRITIDATSFTGELFLGGTQFDDVLLGGSGNDLISVGGGSDFVKGGAGTDTVSASAVINMILTNTNVLGNGNVQLNGIEKANLYGNELANFIDASVFNRGSVRLDGNGGNDSLIGGQKADLVFGGSGNDTLTGGAGDDTLIGNQGINQIVETKNTNFVLTNKTLTGNGTDTLFNIGGATLTGGSSNNTLNASGFTMGGVTLNGEGGEDKLLGSSKNDTLLGGAGNDTLRGNAGTDNLTGGAGSDRFTFASGNPFNFDNLGSDAIVDFVSGTDKIVLEKTTFDALKSDQGNGFNKSSDFAIANSLSAALTSSASIVYISGTGNLVYNQNGSAAGIGTGAVFARLQNAPALAPSDFVIQ